MFSAPEVWKQSEETPVFKEQNGLPFPQNDPTVLLACYIHDRLMLASLYFNQNNKSGREDLLATLPNIDSVCFLDLIQILFHPLFFLILFSQVSKLDTITHSLKYTHQKSFKHYMKHSYLYMNNVLKTDFAT